MSTTKPITKVKLQLFWKHQFEFAGFYAAKEQGYFKHYGLDVEIIEAGDNHDNLKKVFDGEAQFGIGGIDLVESYHKGKHIKFLANYFKKSPLAILTQPNITSLRQLSGKTLHASFDTINRGSLKEMLDFHSVNVKDIKTVLLPNPVDSFVNNKIVAMTAFTTDVTFELNKLNTPYNIFDPNQFGLITQDLNLFTSDHFFKNNESLVKNFVTAANKGWEYALANQQEVIQLIKNKYDSQQKSVEALTYEAKNTEKLISPNLYPIGSIQPNKIKLISQQLLTNNVITEYRNIESFLSTKNNTKKIGYLSEDENNFLVENPILRVQSDDDFPPYNYFANDKPSGYSIDLINLIAKNLNLKVDFAKHGSWQKYKDMLNKNELDVLLNIVDEKSDEQYLSLPSPYVKISTFAVTRKDFPEVFVNKGSLAGKRIAISKDYAINETLKVLLPNSTFVLGNNAEDAYHDIATNKADIYFEAGAVNEYYLSKTNYSNLQLIAVSEELEVINRPFNLATHIDNNILYNILKKAMKKIPDIEQIKLKRKWFGHSETQSIKTVVYTQEELDYISKHKVTFCRPETQKETDIILSVIDLMNQNSGLTIKIGNSANWLESLEQLKNGQCDFISGITNTVERRKYFSFTSPYYKDKHVIVTKGSVPTIYNISDHLDKKFAVIKGTVVKNIIQKDFPDITLVEVANKEEGLTQVKNNGVFGYIQTSLFVKNKLNDTQYKQLKINANLREIYDDFHSIAVKKDNSILHGILSKSVRFTDKEKLASLLNNLVELKSSVLTLTEQEIDFVNNNPIIKMVDTGQNAPLFFFDQQSESKGLIKDYLDVISSYTGLNFDFKASPINKLKEDLLAKKTDGINILVNLPQNNEIANLSLPHSTQHTAIFVKKGNPQNIHQTSDLHGKKMASLTSADVLNEFAQTIPNVDVIYFETVKDMIKGVVSGEADFTFYSEILLFIARKEGLNFIDVAFINDDPIELSFGFRKDLPELKSIIDKAILFMPEEKKVAIRNRWMGQTVEQSLNTFSSQEQTLLDQKEFTLCNSDYAVGWDELLAYLSLNTNIKIKKSEFFLWANVFDALNNGQCDILLEVTETTTRRQTMSFTKPIHNEERVIVTALDQNFIINIEDHLNEQFVLQAGDNLILQLQSQYPTIKITTVGHQVDGLNMVKNKKAFAFIGGISNIGGTINRFAISDIKISGSLPDKFNSQWSIATRKDDTVLLQILEKLIQRSDPNKVRKSLFSQYQINAESNFNYSLIGKILIGIFPLFLGILWWNRKLTNINTKINVARDSAENALQKLAFVQLAVDKTGDMAFFIDGQTGAFFYVNESACEVLNYSNQQLNQKNIFNVNPFLNDELWQLYLEKLRNNKLKVLKENYRTQNGQIVPVEVTMQLVTFKDEEKIIVFARDISSRIQFEKNITEARNKAQAANEIKSTFLANMSHEIRTPMNGIIGMTHLIMQTNLNNVQSKYMKSIDFSAKSLLSIINDILDFSKIEAGKMTLEQVEFDLVELLEEILTLIEVSIGDKPIELLCSFSADVGRYFIGDPLRITQVFTNLLSNAVKFTDTGEITVLVTRTADNKIITCIRDTGLGMSTNQIENLFDSFSQADQSTTRKYGGTGLGLAISKQLTELMGGKIWVESTPHVGSKFYFSLQIDRAINDLTLDSFSDRTVLVVDDNETCRSLLVEQLAQFKCHVETASNGSEAIAKYKNHPDKYDLVLMDWNMPELNGIETTQQINKIYEKHFSGDGNAPPTVIMISAHNSEYIVKAAKKAGIDIYLQKPVDPSSLFDILIKVLKRSNRQIKRQQPSSDYIKALKNKMKSLMGSNILLVEDNRINQDIILGLLEGSNINVTIANNGQEALTLFDHSIHELILMDLQMPIMDGYTATQQIREHNSSIPIVALTANVLPEQIIKTVDAGMNAHLSKPIDVPKLFETLLSYIPEKIKINTLIADELVPSLKDIPTVPNFKSIDTLKGLKHCGGNNTLYLNALTSFASKYQSYKLASVDSKSTEIVVHTVKGLSGNIGARNLYEICQRFEEKPNQASLQKFNDSLRHVVVEIHQTLSLSQQLTGTSSECIEDKALIPDVEFHNLLKQLQEAVKSKRPKSCTVILNEIDLHQLNKEDERLLNDVKVEIKRYRYKDALSLLNQKLNP